MLRQTPEQFKQNYPEDLYTEQKYSFSKQEISLITSYNAIVVMGQLAEDMINRILHNAALPRVGHTSRNGVGTLYDIANGTFTVYTPKHWCSICAEAAGSVLVGTTYYCPACLVLKKMQEKKKHDEDFLVEKQEKAAAE